MAPQLLLALPSLLLQQVLEPLLALVVQLLVQVIGQERVLASSPQQLQLLALSFLQLLGELIIIEERVLALILGLVKLLALCWPLLSSCLLLF